MATATGRDAPDGQVWRATIWPGPCRSRSSLSVRVRLFVDRKSMRTYRIATSTGERDRRDRRVAGYHRPILIVRYGAGGRARTVPISGEVCVNLRDLGAGYIAHEMLHAALGWARRKRVATTMSEFDAEEALCRAHGWLVKEFWRIYYSHGGAHRIVAEPW